MVPTERPCSFNTLLTSIFPEIRSIEIRGKFAATKLIVISALADKPRVVLAVSLKTMT